ncbi:MAG TPA: hypothetical protein PKN50_08525 [Spirochaetota bacterium]|jgi:hypothetical protein|nr:hypothetical protein [Spirochaetota bacterium]HPV41159.1 hypothetical protein [Spirochaetota bacterium]
MVHIVGIDHLVQYNGPVPEGIRSEFRSYLVQMCRKLDIRVIAEEFSEEALRDVYHASADTAQEAARILGIEHRYCDPGSEQLAELGIPFFGDLREAARIKLQAPVSYILDNALRKKVIACASEMARTYWHIREQYWLDRIMDILDLNILFICGHEHADRFKGLLVEHGHGCAMVERFWKKEVFSDYGSLGLT